MGPEISCALYACRPTYILPRFMCYSQHICGHAFSDPADIYYFPHIAYWPGYIMCEQHMSADIYFRALYAIQLTYITPHCKHTGSIGKHHYIIIFSLLGDVGTHMGSIGKQVITSSLPDWHWHWAQLVSRSHYYVIMLGDVGTHMGLIGKQNLLQLCHYMCYVIRKFSPASLCTSPTHAAHPCRLPMLPTHAAHPRCPPMPPAHA